MTRYSSAHIALYRQHYATVTPRVLAPRWLSLVERLVVELHADSVLDYGCGQVANLAQHASMPVRSYDPAVPAYAAEPESADLVVCMHMLEHVEPGYVPATLLHLWSLADKAALVMVSCQPSTKVLPDGSPWHAFIQSPHWWAETLTDVLAPGHMEPVPVDRPGLEYGAVLWRTGHAPQEQLVGA